MDNCKAALELKVSRNQLVSFRTCLPKRIKAKSGSEDHTYLVRNGYSTNLSKIEAVRKTFWQDGIREFLESNTCFSPSMKQLVILFLKKYSMKKSRVIRKLFDDLAIQKNETIHCK